MKKQTLTDTFGASVTPFWHASVSAMAGDLARALQLVTLITGKAHHCSNCKAQLRVH